MKQEEYNGYKVGAAKRKFKLGKDDFVPGALITKMNESKYAKGLKEKLDATQVAIRGMV